MATTMVGTQAPQKLFEGFAESMKGIPGMVTPNITAAMPSNVDYADIARAQEFQRAQWARAAAINSYNFARQANNSPRTYSSGTGNQSLPVSSGMGATQNTAGSPAVMWAPRNLQGPKLGTWASQQQNRAIAENREMPMVVQAHTGDPYSPNEVGGMPTSSRGLYGPGLTSAMGGANPAVLARMWGGGTKQAQPVGVFPQQSLRERTSPGPQYQYDMWGGR